MEAEGEKDATPTVQADATNPLNRSSRARTATVVPRGDDIAAVVAEEMEGRLEIIVVVVAGDG